MNFSEECMRMYKNKNAINKVVVVVECITISP